MKKEKLSFSDVIEKWKINNTMLAEKMSLSRKAFHLKFRTVGNNRLNENEEAKLKSILKEMANDILSSL